MLSNWIYQIAKFLILSYEVVVCFMRPPTDFHVWRSEDDLLNSDLSFQYVSPSYQNQILRLGSKHFYTLSHPLPKPGYFFE